MTAEHTTADRPFSLGAQLFSVLSPLPAAFNVVAALATFFWIGQIGDWLIDHWLPLMRAVWDGLVAALPFRLSLTVEDKDALTGVVFFLPFGIAGMAAWASGEAWRYEAARSERTMTLLYTAAALIAVICLAAVSFQIVSDAFGSVRVALTWAYAFALAKMTLMALVFVAVLAAGLKLPDLAPKPARLPLKIGALVAITGTGLYLRYRYGDALLGPNPLEEHRASIGLVRDWAFVIIVITLISAVAGRPDRMIRLGLYILGLLALGYLWEGGVALIRTVESQTAA